MGRYWFLLRQEVIEEQESAISMLHADISSKDEESRKHQTMLEEKLRELEDIRNRKSKRKILHIGVKLLVQKKIYIYK